MKRRFYVLGLSLLVLVIALAGLLSVLDVLPKSSTAVQNKSGTTVAPPSTNSTNNQPITTPSTPVNITPDISLSPNFSLSLPDSFKLNLPKFLTPSLALNSTTPPHLPLLKVDGAQNTQYLKSLTSSYYDGTKWLQDSTSSFSPYNGEQLALPNLNASSTITDDITVNKVADIAGGTQALPTALYPVSVNASQPLLYSAEDGTFITDKSFPDQYNFQTIHYSFNRQALAGAQTDNAEQYLQLPSNITARTYKLAQDITGGITSPYLKVKAIEDYLKTNYPYDYKATPAPAGAEPNDWFLFNEKRGVCTNFNSAFVILARASGIPARMAGGFLINAQNGTQTVYADQAHAWSEVNFKDIGWTTFDATGSASTKLTPTKTEITTIGAVATKGDKFTIAGTVWTDTTKPADGTMVEILVNTTKNSKGATKVGEGLVFQGHFEIQAVIPGEMAVGNYQVIAHSQPSAQYAESWSDPSLKVVSGTKIKLELPATLKIGETITVNGLVSGEFGEALAKQGIGISVNGKGMNSPVTDSAGRFTWKQTFSEAGNYQLKAYFAGTEFYLAASQNVSFRVVAPAVIILEVKGDTAGKPVTVSGGLLEQTTNLPLAGRALSVSIDNEKKDIIPTTNDQGKYDFKYTFNAPGTHHIEVAFNGDKEYFTTSTAAPVDIKAEKAFNIRPVIITVLALAAGTGGWFFYRRMKKRTTGPLTINGEELATETEESKPWQSSSAGVTLTIGLPQIMSPLPDVWGMGEELKISFHLRDDAGNGTGIAGELEITADGQSTTTISTGEDGTAEMLLTFPTKGQYNLTASYGKEPDTHKASATRPIRIVDYREEIVDLFNKLVEEFRGMGLAVSDEYTPRKIQYLALDAKMDIPEKPLDDAVTCFEEADYSLHSITRGHYVTMYLAQMELKEHGTKPAAPARS